MSAIFVAGWLLDSSLAWLDPIRASVLIVSSYVLSRIGVARDGTIAHLLPCSALALSAAATGSTSLGACLLPVVLGHVATRSPRWTVLTTFVGLAQAVFALR